MSAGVAEELRYQALQQVDPAGEGALEALLAGLHDESWRVRRVAAEGFARLADPRSAVARLVAVLGERGQTSARNAAAEALVRVGAAALPALQGLLGHADPDQRKFAADILGQLGHLGPAALEAAGAGLVAALSDEDLNVRVAAAEALGGVGGPRAAQALRALLDSGEALLRMAALEALLRLREPPPLAALSALLQEPPLRVGAYRALGLVDDPAALPLLCEGLSAPGRSVREAALGALGTVAQRVPVQEREALEARVREALAPHAQALAQVAEALEGGELAVRSGALVVAAALRDPALALPVARAGMEERLGAEVVHALTQLGPAAGCALAGQLPSLPLPARAAVGEVLVLVAAPPCVGPLRTLLGEPEQELRALAVRALGRSQSAEAISPLLGLLAESELGPAAGRALQQLSAALPAEVRGALERQVEHEPSPAALRALGRVGQGGALGLLRRAARGADPALRAAALDAVADLGEEPGAELARYGLADEAPAVRRAAARALGRVPSPQSAALLQRALRDDDAGVRLAAVEAAGACAALACVPQLQAFVGAEDGGLAWAALTALGRMGALTPAVLQAAARHPDAEVVKGALEAGGTHAAEVAALARPLLAHARWDVRAAAARALGAHGGAQAGGALQQALAHETDGLVREALAEALARLGQQ